MKKQTALRSLFAHRPFAALITGLITLFTATTAQAQRTSNTIAYSPNVKLVQGQMPLVSTYTLSVTSPATLTGLAIVTLNTSLFAPPPTGVSNITALSFVAIVPNILTFTGPNQTINVQVVSTVPLGNWAGSFSYEILTSGWPAGLSYTDPGAFINSTYSAPPVSPTQPIVSISTPVNKASYSWDPTTGNLSVPFSFVGNSPDGSPLTSLTGNVIDPNGVQTNLTFTPTGIGTPNATGNGTFNVSAPGIYTISTADTNANGNATASVQVSTMIMVGPPSVVINTPTPNSAYVLSGSSLTVPATFTGTSQYGGIVTLTANLDGQPLVVTPSGIGNLVATGASNMTLTTTGDHLLEVWATDNYGTAYANTTFTVSAQATNPPPTVVINTPIAPNTTFTQTTGTTLTVPFTFTGSSIGGPITNITATLNGAPVTFSTTGLNTLTANGSTNLLITDATQLASGGSYTLVATATNNGGTAQTTQTFTVTSIAPPHTLKVAITKPVANSSYTIGASGYVIIPDAFVGNTTASGGVTSISATLNGNPISITPGPLNMGTVTATGSLNITTPGNYTLAVTDTDAFGTATASENITVSAPQGCPQITIVKPCDGATYTVGTSTCPLWVPVSIVANTTPGSTLSTLTATLNGSPLTLNITGLGTGNATATTSIKVTTTGTYTIVATTTSGNASAVDNNGFKVGQSGCDNSYGSGSGSGSWGGSYNNWGWNSWCGGSYTSSHQTYCTPPPCTVSWQQSWSCNTTQHGGNSLPLCFQIKYAGSNCTTYWNNYFNNCNEDYYSCDDTSRQCWGSYGYNNCLWGNVPSQNSCLNNHWDRNGCSNDTTVKCLVYEVYSNGSCSSAQTYTCSNKAGSSTCTLNGSDQYNCNFQTAKGTHTYRCDVYYTDSNTGSCFVGQQTFCTR